MSHDTARVAVHTGVREYLIVRHVRERQDLERVHPIGEIDLFTAPALRDALADTDSRDVDNVLVDLSEVRFLALIGVQVLQAAGERKAKARRRLVVVAPTHPVQRVLSLTDVAANLEIYTTSAGARSALAQ